MGCAGEFWLTVAVDGMQDELDGPDERRAERIMGQRGEQSVTS